MTNFLWIGALQPGGRWIGAIQPTNIVAAATSHLLGTLGVGA